MNRWLLTRLCLNLSCLLFLVYTAGAHSIQQSVAITLTPSQSTTEQIEVTVPAVVQTTTQVSMVTVTQMSMQTATGVSMVTQMQTITVPGTCAASTQAIATPSSPDVVTAGALNQIDTSASVAPIASNSGAIVRASDSTATPAAAAASTVLSEQPCDCSCLCPMAAFTMAAYQKAANTTQIVTTSIVQSSTFQTVVSASAANKVVASFSVGSSPPASSVAVTSSTSGSSTSDAAAVATSTLGVLPSNIVTDPGIPTGRPEIQDAQDAALNIGTYQLMKSVALPVVIDRTIRPTVTV